MLYKYNKNSLNYSKIPFYQIFRSLLAIFALIVISSTAFYFKGLNEKIEEMSTPEKFMLLDEADEFSQEKMATMLNDLNVKFPHIVMAQSMIETGHFKSSIFLENNNLFGMRRARVRINTALGTNKAHAYYSTWRESVYDYAFYQATYLHKFKSEKDYFEYIHASYATDKTYVRKIKKMIRKYKLEEMFE